MGNVTHAIIQKIDLPFTTSVQVFMKRDDLVHSEISGNKFYKLKYNLLQAKQLQKKTLLTFGGAFSNHLLAVACAGKENNFDTIGIVRGNEIENNFAENPTLLQCKKLGMDLFFVSREEYREKENGKTAQKIINEKANIYLINEGGTNDLAVLGVKEILNEETKTFDIICCAVGTGGTISGISLAAEDHQKIIGFPALKNAAFLYDDIRRFSNKNNFKLHLQSHFSGYGKVNEKLIQFINQFKKQNQIPLDPIYTGKMMFELSAMIAKKQFAENTKILAIHTGGIQGINGMNIVLKKKNLPILE